MARLSGNFECPNGSFGDSSQQINWILYSGATCHMMPETPDFIPGQLEGTDKKTEVADVHNVTTKQKGQV